MAAINKNFVIKNGVEIGDNLIYGDKDNLKVGIGTTVPAYTLDVRGGIGVTDITASGTVTANSGIFTGFSATSSTFGETVTFRSGVGTELNISGVTTTANLRVSGIATFNQNLNVVGLITTRDLNVVGIATVETLDVQTKFDVYDSQAVFHNDVYIAGNLSIGGTTVSITASDLRVSDKDIVLGVTTDSFGGEISNDTTANHGGIAIASTEGSPLISLQAVGVNTLPDTYKQLMWVRADTFGIGTTDAWLFNYGVGIGSTQVPNGVRLAVSEIQFTDNTINTPNINIAKDLRVSGVSTFPTLDSTWIQVGSGLTFTTGIGTNLFVSGVGTIANLSSGIATVTKVHVGIATTYSEDLVVSGNARITGILTIGTGSITLNGNDDTILVGSGVTIFGQTGIVSAYKFYGDGSSLTGTISGVGIQSGGSLIGAGITQLNFIGSAVTSITSFAGIATINLIAGSGGGTPGGSQGYVQYNNSSVFDGSSNFTFDGNNVNVGGALTATASKSTWSQVGSGLTFTTGIGTNLNVSGVVTTTQLVSTNVNVTGVSTATSERTTWSQVGSGLTFTTGIGTFANISGILTAANLNVTGIGTVGNIALRSTGASGGIITATAGVVTYFGDGSKLTGLSAGVAISTNTTNRDQYLTYSVAATASTTGLGVTTTKLVYNPGLNYLGIGTTSAKAPLHVVDNILVSAGAAATLDVRLKMYTNESGSISFENATDASSIFTLQQSEGDILFDVSTSPTNQVFKVGIDSSIVVSSGIATRDIKIKAYDDELGALSFEDAVDATQYFSITQDLSSILFAVNNASLTAVFTVKANGDVNITGIGTIGTNATGNRTIQSGGTASGGSSGDIYYIY